MALVVHCFAGVGSSSGSLGLVPSGSLELGRPLARWGWVVIWLAGVGSPSGSLGFGRPLVCCGLVVRLVVLWFAGVWVLGLALLVYFKL
jgi:hypothetical protein